MMSHNGGLTQIISVTLLCMPFLATALQVSCAIDTLARNLKLRMATSYRDADLLDLEYRSRPIKLYWVGRFHGHLNSIHDIATLVCSGECRAERRRIQGHYRDRIPPDTTPSVRRRFDDPAAVRELLRSMPLSLPR